MSKAFIERWAASGAAERANKDSFLNELCDLLGVPRPDPTTGDPDRDHYVFERDALLAHEAQTYSVGKIDLYKRKCFILEAKQGSEAGSAKIGSARRGTPGWNIAMHDAFGQALGYARTFDAPPPFIVTCDVGYCFDLYATFDGSTDYRPFPNALHNRLFLTDLADAKHQDTLRTIFTDPMSLDPARHAAKVTREVADHLAGLARQLERAGHGPDQVALFLMRAIFTMFAEDVGLLPERIFTDALAKRWVEKPKTFPSGCEALWSAMDSGANFGLDKVLRFNGGLFAEPKALPLTGEDLELLLEAAKCDWSDVEPAIFGTLLERALDPKERHKLGAHFTPRAYVERLVRPTIEEPLRAEWDLVRAEVRHLVGEGKVKDAQKLVTEYHQHLCGVRVLDPACGSGNFLYVTLDLMKRLEDEVLELLNDLGVKQQQFALGGFRVGPNQFHGIEVKRWAKEIAELVLWIGYLQWHFRRHGRVPPKEPVLQDYKNIECRDAVLAWDSVEPLLDGAGKPVTRWDGESYKRHPATGELVPDESQRVPALRYLNPRKALWPDADFVVGNPPFIGKSRRRQALGDGYIEALFAAYPEVADGADYVMVWWYQAATLTRNRKLRRFGLITTNSITQTLNRKVIGAALGSAEDCALLWAIRDHPWVDSATGAAVRIAMTTVGRPSEVASPQLATVTAEHPIGAGEVAVEISTRSIPRLHHDLRGDADVSSAIPLKANQDVATVGLVLFGQGFVLAPEQEAKVERTALHPLLTGRDIVLGRPPRSVIDLFDLDLDCARRQFPRALQWLVDHVKPERDHIRDPGSHSRWWRFGRDKPDLRKSLAGLRRYVATVEVSKYRYFVFVPADVRPDHTLIAIALDDPFFYGVLSSRIHTAWALASGSHLGVGNDPRYNRTLCFDPFPFPSPEAKEAARIRSLAEALDAHRKKQQTQTSTLTITGMYNVLAKLRSGEALTEKESVIHEEGLVSVLKDLHDQLDAAVFAAYGWPHNLTDEEVLERLVALNVERASEEQQGLIRWLRPEFQNPKGATQLKQAELAVKSGKKGRTMAAQKPAWPKTLPERIAAVRDLLHRSDSSTTARTLASGFRRAPMKDVELALQSLAALGLALAFDAGEQIHWRAASRAAA